MYGQYSGGISLKMIHPTAGVPQPLGGGEMEKIELERQTE